jgi:chromate transport protein ChrA
MTPSEHDSETLRIFAWPAYLVAFLFMVTPLVDFVANVWPLHFGDLQWRYGTSGLLSGFLLTPLLGSILATGLAAALGHHRLLRTVAVLDLVAAVLLLAVALSFVLDAVQYRRNVPAEAVATFDLGTVKSFGKHVAVAVVLAWLGRAGLKAPRPRKQYRPPDKTPLVARPS